jgi:glycerophosphoryl diester phosphodiesterase
MFRISARGGNSVHAPENTQAALLSAYVGGADILEIPVCLTSDGEVVAAEPSATSRLGGIAKRVDELPLSDLRKVELGTKFSVRGAAATPWKRRANSDPPLARIDRLGAVLDILPDDLKLLLELHAKDQDSLVKLTRKVVAALEKRGGSAAVMFAGRTADELLTLRQVLPSATLARLATDAPATTDASTLNEGSPALLVAAAAALFVGNGTSNFAKSVSVAREAGAFPRGILVRPDPGAGSLSEADYARLSAAYSDGTVWAVSTSSTIDIGLYARRLRVLESESFAGEAEPAARFHFGYAKNSPYAHVYQKDGLHVDIATYNEERSGYPVEPGEGGDTTKNRLDALQYQLWDALKTWPFYSGGGFGTAFGIEGSFVATVECVADGASQARMYEMAVVNADPAKHRPGWRLDAEGEKIPNLPQSFRDKSIFFDPHGAPPFVGSEHDEDDGYRINWNLGTDYDNNQYGRPVGNGKTLKCQLRLERRRSFFATYYKDEENSDWVCSGVCRNDSLNQRVYLRCAAKRWRQERDEQHPGPGTYMEVPAFHVTFSNISIRSEITAAEPED